MALFNKSLLQFVAAAITVVLLAGCGGGGGGSGSSRETTQGVDTAGAGSPSADELDQLARVRLATQQNAQYETYTVTPLASGYGVTVVPALNKANGAPVSTLEELPEGIANSAWMNKQQGRLPLRVVLKNGTYRLSQPWVWTAAQSGRADSPIIIEAETKGGVVISGARRVVVSRATHGGTTPIQVDLSSTGITAFDQLWVNGRRAVRARAPNVGSFYFVKGTVSSWSGDAALATAPVDRQAFVSEPAALGYLNGLTAAERSAAVLVAAHSWTTSHHRVAATNAGSEVLLSPASRWAFLSKGLHQRYFIENVPTALDAQGEWYFNASTQRLTYLPTLAEREEDVVLDIPVLNTLLEVRGNAALGQWAEHLVFTGLTFRHGGFVLPAAGLIDQQAAIDVGASLVLRSARHVALNNCEVSRVGGYAVWLRDNVRQSMVQNCEVYDAGAGGVRVGLTNQPASDAATGFNTIRSNRIHAIGFQFPGAVGIWVGQSAHNTVDGNLIGDTTYTGISVGWTWGYGASPSHSNLINRNFLYDVMQGALSDGGGIYTLGISPGTEIKGNVIRGVRAFNNYGSGGWGIYNDEGSSRILVDSNVVLNSDHGGYMLHFGQDNTVSNNVFAGGGLAELQVGRVESGLQARVLNNRLFPSVSSFISYKAGTGTPALSFSGNRVSTQFVSLSSLPEPCGAGCQVADGLAVTATAKLEVPVITEGGAPIDLMQALAPSWSTVGVTPVDSPALIWGKARGHIFDAAEATLGSRPMGFRVVPADRPELIAVAQNQAGDRCLAFNDAASLTNRWEPFGYLEADYNTGTTTATFTLKADAATEFIHEWRDPGASPFLIGPSVTFSGTRGIVVRGQVVGALPVGEWVTVTITATQGSTPRWSMAVRYANNASFSLSNQLPMSEAWTRTRAFYFISNAAATSTPCVGKWAISNEP